MSMLEDMASVGRRLGLPFTKGKSSTKRKEYDLETQRHSYHGGGGVTLLSVPAGRSSKANSVVSTGSDTTSAAGEPQDDLDTIKLDVKNFSAGLRKIKDLFTPEGEERLTGESLKVAAHDKLGEILHMLKLIMQRYPYMQSTEVFTGAALLISRIKGYDYESETPNDIDIMESIDQLALAFTNSMFEYIMNDVETPVPKSPGTVRAKKPDSAPSTPSSVCGREPLRDPDMMTPEEIDRSLHRLDSGVEVALQRAKAWSKYAKDILTYVEKRVQLEADFAKNISHLANKVRPALTEDSFLPFQSVYCTALDQDTEYAHEAQTVSMLIRTKAFIGPLNSKRNDHEKRRKQIKDSWQKELRRMQDAVTAMKKSRALYVQRQQDYDKAREAAAKAETDSLQQSAGSAQVTKLEKKKKQVEEALHRAIESETNYRTCVSDANNRQQELERFKGVVLTQIRELLLTCDETMKTLTIEYFKLAQSLSASVPIQFQALWEASRQYEPGCQYADYVKHLPMPSSPSSRLEPYVFEPYTPDNKASLDELRKPNHSSGSSSELHNLEEQARQLEQGRNWSPKQQRHRLNSDSESMSGSSSRSHESSPSASPFNQSRKTILSGSDLTEADRDGFEVSESGHLRGVSLSKAGLTHTFKRIHVPARCKECENYVYLQGSECERCGIVSHKKCLETMRWECGDRTREVKRRMTTFGIDLQQHVTTMKMEVPYIVLKCISEINMRGLQTKGIYRVSGVKSRVESLCQLFEQEPSNVDLMEHQPHVIANVLKLYFRELPEPLLTYNPYQDFMSLAKSESAVNGTPGEKRVVDELKALINRLPKPNQRTCGLLMHHLNNVTEEEEANQMTATNLGIVFGPTLLRQRDDSSSITFLMDTPHQTRIIELLIIHASDIFGPSSKYECRKKTETLSEPQAEGVERKKSSGDGKWEPPQITQNFMEELVSAEPRFQQVSPDKVPLPGSTVPDSKPTVSSTATAATATQPILSTPKLPDSLKPKEDVSASDRTTPERTSFYSVMLGDAKLRQNKPLVTSSSLSRSNNASFSSLEGAKSTEHKTITSTLTMSSNASTSSLDGVKATEQDSTKQSDTSMSISGQNLAGLPNPSLKLPSLSQPKPYSPPTSRAPVNQDNKEETGGARPKLKAELALARSTFYGIKNPSPTSEMSEKESFPFKEDKDEKQYFV